MSTPIFNNPVVGKIHLPGWLRPAGNIEFIVTSPFGPRDLNGDGDKLDANENHDGIDLGNSRCGDPVLAAAAGTVVNSGKDIDGAIFGILAHPGGWRSYYWHLATELLDNGTAVAAGEQIGTIGRTGNASGCHLHFTIKQLVNGLWVNVDPWLLLAQNQPEDSMTIVTYVPFPEGSRQWTANTSKTYTGYHPDGSTTRVMLSAGSTAPASGIASISQSPLRAPNGSGFVLIAEGPLAGYYMLRTDGTVTAAPPVPVGFTQQDMNDAKAAGRAEGIQAAKDDLADLK